MRKGEEVTVAKVWYLIKKIYQAVNEVPTFNIKSMNTGKIDSLDRLLNVHSKQIFSDNTTLTELYSDVQRALTGLVPERITFSSSTYTGTAGVPVTVSWTHVGGTSPESLYIEDIFGNITVLLDKTVGVTSHNITRSNGVYKLLVETTSGYSSTATLTITT